MNDLEKQELINEIADLLVVYMKSGNLVIQSFLNKLHLNINELEQLLDIHFILRDDVKSFVAQLPQLLRNLKTSTTENLVEAVGEVRGPVHWQKTLTKRYNTNPLDHTHFVYHERSRTYDTKENLVLKACLKTIHRIINQYLNLDHKSSYQWIKEWKELGPRLNEIIVKNVYIKRIKGEEQITDRMIRDTLKHRSPLYRKAAALLLTYRRIMKFELFQEEVAALLSQTFITPEREEVLFELYWVIQLIKQNSENAKLNIVDGRRNLVASWEKKGLVYEIYHDSIGSRALNFEVTFDEIKESNHPYLTHMSKSHTSTKYYAKALFNYNTNESIWSGRPDIMIEIKDKATNRLKRVILGEVKDTDSREYAVKGLSELIDYMTYVKDNKGYYLDEGPEIKVEGMLFLGNVQVSENIGNKISVVTRGNGKEGLILG